MILRSDSIAVRYRRIAESSEIHSRRSCDLNTKKRFFLRSPHLIDWLSLGSFDERKDLHVRSLLD